MERSIIVVIPTLNEAPHIESVLSELQIDLPGDHAVRFVVVDGGSVDGTVDVVLRVAQSRSDVVLLHNPLRIQSAAVNLAVDRFGAGAGVLVRCDAHARYPAGFIRQLVETQVAQNCDSVVVPMDTIGEHGLQKAVAWISNTRLGTGGAAHRGGRQSGFVDHGHHGLMLISSFERAGRYDESFTHNEDAEFDCRLRATGGSIYLNAEIRIGYWPRSTLGGLWRQYFNYGMGRSKTARRHPGSLKARQVAVPAYLLTCLASIVAVAISPALAAPAVLYLGILGGASAWFCLRTCSLAGLLTGPATLTMHSAWAAGFLIGLVSLSTPRWDTGSVAKA